MGVIFHQNQKILPPPINKRPRVKLRSQNSKLKKMRATIIVGNEDSSQSNQQSIKQCQLSFALWSDPDHRFLSDFGAWDEKKCVPIRNS